MTQIGDLFDTPDKPDVALPKVKKPKRNQQAREIEESQSIQDDSAGASQREKRKRLLSGGRKSTVLTGTQTQLKKRLGE
jgi:hypothetical protein